MSNFHFLRPSAFFIFIPLVLIISLLIFTNREKKNWKDIIAPALQPFMFSKGSRSAIALPVVLFFVGMSCMIFSLAGPTWKKRAIPGEKIPAVVLIALDMSKSMLTTDIQPNRLERAKLKISDFLDANPRARAGLLAFAGTPHPVLPFTGDYKIIKFHTGSLFNWEMPVQGTNYALLMDMADTLLAKVKAPSTLLLMTDVIDDAAAVQINNFANNSIHRVEVVLFSPSSEQSAATLANLRQNEKITVTGITLDKSDVEGVAQRISQHLVFEKDKKEDANEWDDMGWIFLVPAAFIALFWFRRGWVVQWCLLPFMLLTMISCGTDSRHPNWWYTPDYQAQLWYNAHDYAKAADLYTDNAHKAVAYYKAGDYDAAAYLFALDTSAAGQHNYKLAMQQLGRYNQAPADSVKGRGKGTLKERKPTTEDEQLSSDTEVKKMPTTGDRLSDETESDIHRGKEQKFPPKDFKMETSLPIDTKILMQQTNADPGEFLHRRFQIQQQRYFPNVKEGKDIN